MLDVGPLRVQDRAEIIPAADEVEIARESEAIEKATSDQVAVLTVRTLGGTDVKSYSIVVGNQMGVGQADKDNGVLIVVAPKERKVRIAVGYGLEGLLTDQRAQSIVNKMVPLFRSGRGGEAIKVGMKEIDAVLRSDLRRPQYLKKAA